MIWGGGSAELGRFSHCRHLHHRMAGSKNTMNHVDPAGTGTVILGCSCNCLRLPPQEKMLCYECSHMYDPQMMESVLGDLYLHFHRILDPLNQGQPVTRQRLWGIMLKKSSLAEWSFGMSLKGGWPHSGMDKGFFHFSTESAKFPFMPSC